MFGGGTADICGDSHDGETINVLPPPTSCVFGVQPVQGSGSRQRRASVGLFLKVW